MRIDRISMHLVAVTLLLLACSCRVGPNYRRPSVSAPPAFKEQPPAGWKEAKPIEAADKGKWWEVYGDQELARLEAQVRISNQNLKIFEAQYREARDQVVIARSGLFPSISIAPGVTSARTSQNLSTRSTVNFISGTRTQYTLPLEASYTADVIKHRPQSWQMLNLHTNLSWLSSTSSLEGWTHNRIC